MVPSVGIPADGGSYDCLRDDDEDCHCDSVEKNDCAEIVCSARDVSALRQITFVDIPSIIEFTVEDDGILWHPIAYARDDSTTDDKAHAEVSPRPPPERDPDDIILSTGAAIRKARSLSK